MRKMYLVLILVFIGTGSANMLFENDFHTFSYNDSKVYNSTDILIPSGFQDSIMVFTKYNSSNQISAIIYQDLILFSDDKYIVDKINNLEAATVWA